jgi:nitrite reductase [NAD(P)H] large subunit
MSEPLVIIGNGMAAARLVDELASRTLCRYAIAVVGDEPRLAYNRVLLSALLADEIAPAELELKPPRWWAHRGITLRYGREARAIDPIARTVTLADGAALPFAKLVLATGSQPITLAIPGTQLSGVLTFRNVGDVAAMTGMAGPGKRVVVIGGGLLGLEAANGLAKTGVRVTLVHLMDRLMERQLDARAAEMLKTAIEDKGIRVLLRTETEALVGSRAVEAVALKNGRRLPADLVVMAAGTRPRTGLAAAGGIKVRRGIVVGDGLETSSAGIYAVGDCAEHRGLCYGLVEPAYEQVRVLARRLAGEDVSYPGSVCATNLKVAGLNVFSAGDFLGEPGTEQIVLCDPGLGSYKKLVLADDRLVGAVLFGDTGDGPWYFDLIRSGASVAPWRDELIFGRALALRVAA